MTKTAEAGTFRFMRSRSGKRPAHPVRSIDFHTTKYGPETLIDVAWVHEMPTFLLDTPHALTFHDIILVTRGSGTFHLDEQRYAVRPGTLFFTAPGEVRRWQVQGLDGICLFFPALFLEAFFSDASFLHRLPYFHGTPGTASLRYAPRSARALRRRLVAMRGEVRAQRSDSVHLLRAGLYEVLITLARDYAKVHGVSSDRAVHPVVLRFLDLVERDFRRYHQIARYAEKLGVSPGHLSARCREYGGRSAKAILRRRLEVEARRLLLFTDDSAERVGFALGFHDPSYFTRFFRLSTGRTPSVFRRESRG